MNKKHNKSVKKTKHRVQKTKRSQRLNKNRSIKGIRSYNNTNVVEKRRKIVQRGGARIDDLVRRIFGLDQITDESVRKKNEIDEILENVSVTNTQERTPIEIDGRIVDEGMTLLYAACRLVNPSIYLVQGILEKMRLRRPTTWEKIRGIPGSVTSMVKIIPNGSSNGSYPQHGAIQAVKINLENISLIGEKPCLTRLNSIIAILEQLKSYDAEERKFEKERKFPKTASQTHAEPDPPLMERKNKLPKGDGTYSEYTAYEEFNGWFNSIPSIKDRLGKLYVRSNIVIDFENALGLHDHSPWIALPHGHPHSGSTAGTHASTYKPPISAASSPLPPGWVERIDPVTKSPYYENLTNGQTLWDRPVAVPAPAAAAPADPFPYTLLSTKMLPGAGVQGLLPSTAPAVAPALNQSPVAAIQPTAASSSPLPPGGVERMDPRYAQSHYEHQQKYFPPPHPWKMLQDKTGRPYYVNTETGESKWKWW